MKIAIRNYYIDKYGLCVGAEKMALHGYKAIDFQFTDTESSYYTAREEDFLDLMFGIKKELKKNNIEVHQIHGPWQYPPNDASEDDRAERFGKMTKAMVMAKHLGAKYMAVHPLMPFGANSAEKPEEVYSINKKYYEALAKVGSGLGVVVCLENMPFTDFPLSGCAEILKLVKAVDSPYLKMCFDVGHSNIMGEPLYETLALIKDDLRIVHIHDNDGEKDLHLPPYEGNIDWMTFSEGLYDIGFDGVLSLETEADKYGSSSEENEIKLANIGRLISG